MAVSRFLYSILLIAALLKCECLFAQTSNDVPFNGVVTDMLDQPLKGVTIWVENENKYSKSDKKGRFGLTNVQATDTLHLRYRKIRYNIPVQGKKSIRIRLGDQLEVHEDETLVNLGYGYVKQRERLIPTSGISGEDLVKTGKTNLLEALTGKLAGVQITGGRVIIRGVGTNSDHTDPLFIVDGMIVPSLDYVMVNTVDHVEVLKDASIYGAQGANGAILVTLKSGKSR